MVFYSLNESYSQRQALNWARSVKEMWHNIPFAFVGTKSDMNPVHIPCDTSEFNNAPSFTISSKFNSNIEDPFNYLTNCLLPEVVEFAEVSNWSTHRVWSYTQKWSGVCTMWVNGVMKSRVFLRMLLFKKPKRSILRNASYLHVYLLNVYLDLWFSRITDKWW